jgi:hypothetical protein
MVREKELLDSNTPGVQQIFITKSLQTIRPDCSFLLPHLDSNQEPLGYWRNAHVRNNAGGRLTA